MIKEVEKYLQSIEDLKHVSKGGKDYAACSFMDISVRIEREKVAKDVAIRALGELALEKVLNA